MSEFDYLYSFCHVGIYDVHVHMQSFHRNFSLSFFFYFLLIEVKSGDSQNFPSSFVQFDLVLV